MMKKLISFTLCLVLAMSSAISVVAAEKENFQESGINESTIRFFATQRVGDVDADGSITASDARLCLRAAAKLEVLTEKQQVAADINNILGITSADARKILRAAAKLEVINENLIGTTITSETVIGPLKTAGSGQYSWQYSVDKAGLLVKDYKTFSENDAPAEQHFLLAPGAPAEQFFCFYT